MVKLSLEAGDFDSTAGPELLGKFYLSDLQPFYQHTDCTLIPTAIRSDAF
jgi:hypothetical protein